MISAKNKSTVERVFLDHLEGLLSTTLTAASNTFSTPTRVDVNNPVTVKLIVTPVAGNPAGSVPTVQEIRYNRSNLTTLLQNDGDTVAARVPKLLYSKGKAATHQATQLITFFDIPYVTSGYTAVYSPAVTDDLETQLNTTGRATVTITATESNKLFYGSITLDVYNPYWGSYALKFLKDGLFTNVAPPAAAMFLSSYSNKGTKVVYADRPRVRVMPTDGLMDEFEKRRYEMSIKDRMFNRRLVTKIGFTHFLPSFTLPSHLVSTSAGAEETSVPVEERTTATLTTKMTNIPMNAKTQVTLGTREGLYLKKSLNSISRGTYLDDFLPTGPATTIMVNGKAVTIRADGVIHNTSFNFDNIGVNSNTWGSGILSSAAAQEGVYPNGAGYLVTDTADPSFVYPSERSNNFIYAGSCTDGNFVYTAGVLFTKTETVVNTEPLMDVALKLRIYKTDISTPIASTQLFSEHPISVTKIEGLQRDREYLHSVMEHFNPKGSMRFCVEEMAAYNIEDVASQYIPMPNLTMYTDNLIEMSVAGGKLHLVFNKKDLYRTNGDAPQTANVTITAANVGTGMFTSANIPRLMNACWTGMHSVDMITKAFTANSETYGVLDSNVRQVRNGDIYTRSMDDYPIGERTLEPVYDTLHSERTLKAIPGFTSNSKPVYLTDNGLLVNTLAGKWVKNTPVAGSDYSLKASRTDGIARSLGGDYFAIVDIDQANGYKKSRNIFTGRLYRDCVVIKPVFTDETVAEITAAGASVAAFLNKRILVIFDVYADGTEFFYKTVDSMDAAVELNDCSGNKAWKSLFVRARIDLDLQKDDGYNRFYIDGSFDTAPARAIGDLYDTTVSKITDWTDSANYDSTIFFGDLKPVTGLKDTKAFQYVKYNTLAQPSSDVAFINRTEGTVSSLDFTFNTSGGLVMKLNKIARAETSDVAVQTIVQNASSLLGPISTFGFTTE